jgi:[ribosomal protein S5]-alanine N-acetyltransferase
MLRPLERGDVADMHEVMRRPEAMRYWSTLSHADLATTAAWMERKLARRVTGTEFAMVLEDRVIGTVGGDPLPEIGFILHPDHWGKGLVTEAMAVVVAHIFASHPVPALTADVDPRNAASLRVLEQLGFVVVGEASNTFLLGEEWCDSVYLRLERAD